MTALALKIVQTKRPSSGKVIGYRIVLANLNLSGWDVQRQDYCQSFAPCHRVCESGDYSEVTPEILERYVARMMKWHRIDQIIPFG